MGRAIHPGSTDCFILFVPERRKRHIEAERPGSEYFLFPPRDKQGIGGEPPSLQMALWPVGGFSETWRCF